MRPCLKGRRAGALIDKIDSLHRNIWASALSPEGLSWRTMNVVYSTTVSSVGGRDGTIRSDDGILDLKVATPHSLGGAGRATNPEQLFAAGYAANRPRRQRNLPLFQRGSRKYQCCNIRGHSMTVRLRLAAG
jgi:hypothetical protein